MAAATVSNTVAERRVGSTPTLATTKGYIMTPVWLLDIDGVVNKLGRPNPGDNTGIAGTSDGGLYNINWSSSVVDFINKTIDSGRAEVRLCSTWVSDAKTITDLLGLPELPLAFPADTNRYQVRAAKLEAAVDLLDAEAPFVWTDDEAIPFHFRGSDTTLLIDPDPYKGLTEGDLAVIDHFLDIHSLEYHVPVL
jgi:hypothetical protein